MDFEIFTSDKDKAEARHALAELVEHPGWKFIQRALDLNIEHARLMLEEEEFESVEEVVYTQERLADLRSYAKLPTLLLEAAQEDISTEEESIYPEPPTKKDL